MASGQHNHDYDSPAKALARAFAIRPRAIPAREAIALPGRNHRDIDLALNVGAAGPETHWMLVERRAPDRRQLINSLARLRTPGNFQFPGGSLEDLDLRFHLPQFDLAFLDCGGMSASLASFLIRLTAPDHPNFQTGGKNRIAEGADFSIGFVHTPRGTNFLQLVQDACGPEALADLSASFGVPDMPPEMLMCHPQHGRSWRSVLVTLAVPLAIIGAEFDFQADACWYVGESATHPTMVVLALRQCSRGRDNQRLVTRAQAVRDEVALASLRCKRYSDLNAAAA